MIARYKQNMPLLKEMVRTDFKLRYQSSALGYLWSFLKPLFMFVVLYMVFSKFLRFGGEPLSLLLGIIVWNFFVESTNISLKSIVGKGNLIRKIDMPKYLIVLASVISALINLLIALLIVAVSSLVFGQGFGWSALWMAPLLIEFVVFTFGVSLFLASVYVKVRDINYIWDVLIRMGFYLVPIIYPISLLESRVENANIVKIMLINPVAQIIQDMRHVLTEPGAIRIYDKVESPYVFLPFIFVGLILVFGITVFRRLSPSFAEDV